MTIAAGGVNWFVSKVSVTNLDGGATRGPWETFMASGGRSASLDVANPEVNAAGKTTKELTLNVMVVSGTKLD